jgi:hypothetical protein
MDEHIKLPPHTWYLDTLMVHGIQPYYKCEYIIRQINDTATFTECCAGIISHQKVQVFYVIVGARPNHAI